MEKRLLANNLENRKYRMSDRMCMHSPSQIPFVFSVSTSWSVLHRCSCMVIMSKFFFLCSLLIVGAVYQSVLNFLHYMLISLMDCKLSFLLYWPHQSFLVCSCDVIILLLGNKCVGSRVEFSKCAVVIIGLIHHGLIRPQGFTRAPVSLLRILPSVSTSIRQWCRSWTMRKSPCKKSPHRQCYQLF